MNKETLFACIGDLDEALIQRSEEAKIRTTAEVVGSPRRLWSSSLLKAAAIILAILIAGGGTVAIAAGFLSRYDRYKQMDEESVENIYEDIQAGGALSYLTSRDFTQSEYARYDALEGDYKANRVMPTGELPVVRDGESPGVLDFYLQITDTGEENILHLPKEELTDEQLLEIIEYTAKQIYVLVEKDPNIQTRFKELTDEQIDYYYFVINACKYDVWGGYGGERNSLSAKEETEYSRLKEAYEKEELFPAYECPVIDYVADYHSDTVAYAKYDGLFYLPEKELTDEEILEMIDLYRKILYTFDRIQSDILVGRRSGYPTLPGKEYAVEKKAFHENAADSVTTTFDRARVGDSVIFGAYEQDGDRENGPEALFWYVLDMEGDRMTLLAMDVVCSSTFSTADQNASWASSVARAYLNNEFYNTAFNEGQKAKICVSSIDNSDGVTTEDKVYLLSTEELLSYFGVPSERIGAQYGRGGVKEVYEYLAGTHTELDSRIYGRLSKKLEKTLSFWNEEMVQQIQTFHRVDMSWALGQCDWWLRSFDPDSNVAYVMGGEGAVNKGMYESNTNGLRPVIQITVNK